MSADSPTARDRDRDLLARPLVAVANEDDARATAHALGPYLDDGTVVAVHVVEKAGGAPDKAPMEAVEQEAEEAFDVLREELGDIETELRYGTDVVESLLEAADDHGASALVVVPRPGGRLVRLLTGDIALRLVTESDRPVVSLPTGDEAGGEDAGEDTDEE